MSDEQGGQRRRTRRSGGGEFTKSAGYAAARGALLVGLAVVIGVVLLQIVDDGTTGPVSADGEVSGTTVTTAVATTTTTPLPERSAEEVRVLVLNGGAPSGSAGNMSQALQDVGYTNQPVPPSNWDQRRTGNAVMCREGFEQEAETLAGLVGEGTEVLPFSDPPPPDSDEADCVVIVGAPAG